MVSPRPIWPEASLNLSAPTASICLAPCLACCVVDSAAILRWLPGSQRLRLVSSIERLSLQRIPFLDSQNVEVWLVLVRWVSAYAHNSSRGRPRARQ